MSPTRVGSSVLAHLLLCPCSPSSLSLLTLFPVLVQLLLQLLRHDVILLQLLQQHVILHLVVGLCSHSFLSLLTFFPVRVLAHLFPSPSSVSSDVANHSGVFCPCSPSSLSCQAGSKRRKEQGRKERKKVWGGSGSQDSGVFAS